MSTWLSISILFSFLWITSIPEFTVHEDVGIFHKRDTSILCHSITGDNH